MKKIFEWIKGKLNIRYVVRCADAYFECPSCKYRITETERTMARLNYKCPRCGRSTIFGFYKVKHGA